MDDLWGGRQWREIGSRVSQESREIGMKPNFVYDLKERKCETNIYSPTFINEYISNVADDSICEEDELYELDALRGNNNVPWSTALLESNTSDTGSNDQGEESVFEDAEEPPREYSYNGWGKRFLEREHLYTYSDPEEGSSHFEESESELLAKSNHRITLSHPPRSVKQREMKEKVPTGDNDYCFLNSNPETEISNRPTTPNKDRADRVTFKDGVEYLILEPRSEKCERGERCSGGSNKSSDIPGDYISSTKSDESESFEHYGYHSHSDSDRFNQDGDESQLTEDEEMKWEDTEWANLWEHMIEEDETIGDETIKGNVPSISETRVDILQDEIPRESDSISDVVERVVKSPKDMESFRFATINMQQNCHTPSIIGMMRFRKIHIIAIQEPMGWCIKNKDGVLKNIKVESEACNIKSYVSSNQVVLVDEKAELHVEGEILLDGRVIDLLVTLKSKTKIQLISVYGVPLGKNPVEEADRLRISIRNELRRIINGTTHAIFIQGDLQDCPSKAEEFHIGTFRANKQKNGIALTCEEMELNHSVYKFIDEMSKPIVSRYSYTNGGRLIDGCYVNNKAWDMISNFEIIDNSGISSDHKLLVHTIKDLLRVPVLNNIKTEVLLYDILLEIPVEKGDGDEFQVKDDVYNGPQHIKDIQLFKTVQETFQNNYSEEAQALWIKYVKYKQLVIQRTKNHISPLAQQAGTLIGRQKADEDILNGLSRQFFDIMKNLMRDVELIRMKTSNHDKALNTRRKLCQGSLSTGLLSDKLFSRIKSIKNWITMLNNSAKVLKMEIKRRKDSSDTVREINKRWIKLEKEATQLEKSLTDEYSERRAHMTAVKVAKDPSYHDITSANAIKLEFRTISGEISELISGTTRKHPANETLDTVGSRLVTELLTEIKNRSTTTELNPENVSKDSTKQMIHTLKDLETALLKISRIEWEFSNEYSLTIGKTGNLSRKINPKDRGAPKPSTFFPRDKRLAVTLEEKIDATLETHNMWVGDPPGTINCNHISLLYDEVGPFSIEIDPSDNFDNWDSYCPGLQEEFKERVVEAHQRTAPFFDSIRKKYSEVISYPFKYDCTSGVFMSDEVDKALKRVMSGGKGKARVDGFSVAVLGRLPSIMASIYRIKTELHLVLRILDKNTEQSHRVCIPKNDGSGNVRPITVSHDDNAFINGIVQQVFQKQVKTILLDSVKSFKEGVGCADATIPDCVIKEIALEEGDMYVAVIDQDQEKMYDRIHRDLQALIMINAGASEGYVTWQLANMHNRTTKIITDLFERVIPYHCGLPQGVGFSCEISNLFTHLFLQWCGGDHSFPFQACGNRMEVNSLGYVDDTKRYIAVKKGDMTQKELLEMIQTYLDRSADLSITTKMGLAAKKSSVTIYNLDMDTQVEDFDSTTWSYDQGGIVSARIKATVIRNTSRNQVLRHKENCANLSEEAKRTLEYKSYLGVKKNAFQDNGNEVKRLSDNMINRIQKTGRTMNKPEEIRAANNMVVMGIASFSVLCIHFSLTACAKVDKALTSIYSPRLGYCKSSDAKHAFFISREQGGHGLQSFTIVYITAVIREVEVNINQIGTLHSIALEASLKTAKKRRVIALLKLDQIPRNCSLWEEAQHFQSRQVVQAKTVLTQSELDIPTLTEETNDDEEYDTCNIAHHNMMYNNVELLSKLGVFLRSMKSELSTRITEELIPKRFKVIGDEDIKGRDKKDETLEGGINSNDVMEYSIIGKIPILIDCAIEMARNKTRNLQEPDTRAREFLTSTAFYKENNILPKEVAAKRLANATKVAIQKMANDYALMGMTGLSEWRRTIDEYMTGEDMYNEEKYELILPPNKAYQPDIFSTMQENSEKMLSKTIQHTELKPTDNTQKVVHGKERLSDSEILRRATLNYTVPLMIATDGSSKDGSATASMIILGPDVKDGEENKNEWANREAIPLLVRTIQLPSEIGTEETTNNTAELVGIIIAAISIPADMVQIIITDSENAWSNTCNIMEIKTHRKLIRKVGQGVSQALTNFLKKRTEEWKLGDIEDPPDMLEKGKQLLKSWDESCEMEKREETDDENSVDDQENEDSETSQDDESFAVDQEKDTVSRKVKFNKDQWSTIGRNLISRVYSHQKENPSPNRFCVSGNNMADQVADIAHKLKWKSLLPAHSREWGIWIPPFSNPYTYVIKGKASDKGGAKVFKDLYKKELSERLQARVKQGQLQRHIPSIYNAHKLSEKSIERDVQKGSAVSWNRYLYMHVELPHKILNINGDSPLSTGNGWQNHEYSHQIKRCPFCLEDAEGNSEHLHCFCQNPHLVKCRRLCNTIIREQLVRIYDSDEALQDTIESAARETELCKRRIIEGNELVMRSRVHNISVVDEDMIQTMLEEDNVPQYLKDSLLEFPLLHKCGLITSMLESQYDPSTSTVMDISFMGIIPKAIANKIPKELRSDLIACIEARTIAMQEVIYALVMDQAKTILEDKPKGIIIQSTAVEPKRFDANELALKLKAKCSNKQSFDWVTFGRECGSCFNSVPPRVHFLAGPLHAIMTEYQPNHGVNNPKSPMEEETLEEIEEEILHECTRCDGDVCKANKLFEDITFPGTKVTLKICTACENEKSARKTATRLEETFLRERWPDELLQELIEKQTNKESISLVKLKLTLQNGFGNMELSKNSRIENHTILYLAHSLTIKVDQHQVLKGDFVGNSTDEQRKQIWRSSMHTCRCTIPNKTEYGCRSFCVECKLLSTQNQENTEGTNTCIGCMQQGTNFCNHCQMANILFRNRIADKIQEKLATNQTFSSDRIVSATTNNWRRDKKRQNDSTQEESHPQTKKRRSLN